jgi:hypothetical protein
MGRRRLNVNVNERASEDEMMKMNRGENEVRNSKDVKRKDEKMKKNKIMN